LSARRPRPGWVASASGVDILSPHGKEAEGHRALREVSVRPGQAVFVLSSPQAFLGLLVEIASPARGVLIELGCLVAALLIEVAGFLARLGLHRIGSFAKQFVLLTGVGQGGTQGSTERKGQRTTDQRLVAELVHQRAVQLVHLSGHADPSFTGPRTPLAHAVGYAISGIVQHLAGPLPSMGRPAARLVEQVTRFVSEMGDL